MKNMLGFKIFLVLGMKKGSEKCADSLKDKEL